MIRSLLAAPGKGRWLGGLARGERRCWASTEPSASSSSSPSRPSGTGREEASVRLMFDTKVSESGTSEALFQECIDAVRQRRAELHMDPAERVKDTGAITELKQDEIELTRKIFQRVDPSRDVTSDLAYKGHDIDPYWSPFNKIRDLKEQVTAEFDEYARLVSVAEQKRVRIQIRKSLKRCANVYNPYSREFRNWHSREVPSEMPKPFRMPDRHWEPNPLQVRLAKEKITWRDLDIIQHFIADNGYILPRRTTMLSRKQQKDLVQAVRTAQVMALLPYKWRLPDYQAMPLMDPLQWTVDRLTDRWMEGRDKRSKAMLQVLMERNPELNYQRFLAHEAELAEAEAARKGGAASHPPGGES